MKHFMLTIAFLIALCGCDKEAKKDKVSDLEAEVLTIHDEVMPQMDAIMTLKSKLSKKIQSMDSLQNEGISSNTLAEQRIKAADLNQKLNESDKLMMTWMHEYRGDSAKKLKPEEAISYFEKEKEKILLVKQTTIKSIQEAQTFLE
ncbi:viral A-type inclusion protein [Dyadobacter pollutisoli]|uniref:Viral A-type inclusion protein n=1 Tax=Dyadobacter pollutisoli TaxID=2910158 RepID=A0A9E8NCB4_9BACT|nr:viral A-type inclusion protein [Dyadobacter pollutisoli]WAC12382.1 viral A-type inclusion protein [Dyadobacter pollutisoli]